MNYRLSTGMRWAAVALAFTPVLASCEMLYGLTRDNRVITFDSASPSTILNARFIAGQFMTDHIVSFAQVSHPGFTFDNVIFGMDVEGELFRINPDTGAATLQAIGGPDPDMNGTAYGMAFEYNSANLHVVSDTRVNQHLPLGSGPWAQDPSLSYAAGDPHAGAAPAINAMAFSRDGSNTLYGVDANTDSFVSINSATGVVHTTSTSNRQMTGITAMLFTGSDATTPWLAFQEPTSGTGSILARVDVTTGSFLGGGGTIGTGGDNYEVISLAAAPVPEPASLAILGLGLAAVARRRRRVS